MSIPDVAIPRILVIDDSPASIHIIARALAPDFASEFALSGSEALARLTTNDLPDLIRLDLTGLPNRRLLMDRLQNPGLTGARR